MLASVYKREENGSAIEIKERLAMANKEIKERSDSHNMVTTSRNSQEKFYTKSGEWKFGSIPIERIRTLDDLKDKAVKYERYQLRKESNNLPHMVKTPRTN